MLKESILKEISSRKLKQSDLHKQTGISKNQLSGFFKGKSLNIENLDKLCLALDLKLIKIL